MEHVLRQCLIALRLDEYLLTVGRNAYGRPHGAGGNPHSQTLVSAIRGRCHVTRVCLP